MNIEALNSIAPTAPPLVTPEATASAPTGDFGQWFVQQLAQTNDQLIQADQGLQQLAAGEASNLHQVMINLEEAKLSLQLVMQVRNHLLDAYRDLMQMQV